MMKLENSEVGTMTETKEVIEIDSATEEESGKMLAICDGEVNTSRELVNVLPEEADPNSMQIVCVDDDFDPGLDVDCDLEYMKFLSICQENGNPFLLEDIMREDDTPLRIMYNVDNDESDRKKVVKSEKRKVGIKTKITTKRLKTEYKPISRNLLKAKTPKQEKGVARQENKIALTKNSTEPRKRGRPRKYPVTESNLKVSKKKKKKDKEKKKKKEKEKKKKKNEKSSAKRIAKSQTMIRAPKRLKTEHGRVDHYSSSRTIPVVKTTDNQRKKVEALPRRKITVSTSHAKERKENAESLVLLDKSYAYYLGYLRKSITIFDADRQVEVVKDIVPLSDPDIVAVSDLPFDDGGRSLFETNKDHKVIDVEHDAIDIFNSSFSNRLIEILRKPYEEEQFRRLYEAASVNRPLTRSRQLRDGREIEYAVDHQFAPSLLDQYPDFEKKFRRHQWRDPPRALNLLRGFLFYFENLILDGAFKPWQHEKRLKMFFSDASECRMIECTPHHEALES